MTGFEDTSRHPGLPPEYEAYIGPEEPLPNAIGAVQNLFGEPFSSEVIDAVETLPPKQAEKLMSDIRMVTYRASIAIGARTSSTDYPKDDTFSALALEDVHLLYVSQEASNQPLPETPRLKQAALYCARTIIRDTISDRIVDDNPGRVLARRLREIEPIAGLIQAGVFIPVPKLDRQAHNILSSTLMRSDPYVAHLLAENPAVAMRIRSTFEDMVYEASSLTDLADPMANPMEPDTTQIIQECSQILCEIYPEFSNEKLVETLMYCSQARQGSFTPIAPDRAISRHLLQCNVAAFQGGESSYSRVMQQAPSGPFVPAFTHAVPSLSEVSFKEILALRRSEEVFAKVSAALNALSRACGGEAQYAESYQAYMDLVRQHSEETIKPVYEELSQWHDKALKREQIAGLSSEAIGLGLDIVSVPGLSRLASATSRRVATGKRTVPRRTNAGIGARILKTFL